MKHRVTVIPGDHIGPEVISAAMKCVDATGVKIEWDEQQAGLASFKKTRELLPSKTINSFKKNKVSLKGPMTTELGKGFRSITVKLRKDFDMFAGLRPAKLMHGIESHFDKVDLVVVRENTEDLYSGIEFQKGKQDTKKIISQIKKFTGHKVRSDSALTIKANSVFASKRIIEFAFNYAKENNRKKVTVVTKANILKYSDGLFLNTARRISKKFPKIELDEKLIDNLCMQLVQRPENYDVMVLPNLYGDIVSDLCAGLTGGLGIARGANIGKKYSMFEAVHGSAPKHAGKNKVNPTAMILSAALMLNHLGEKKASKNLEEAVEKVVFEKKKVTYDLKPKTKPVGTQEMAQAIINKLI